MFSSEQATPASMAERTGSFNAARRAGSAAGVSVPHRQAQVDQQLEEPVVAPQVGSARTEFLLHVYKESVAGQTNAAPGVRRFCSSRALP